MHAVHLPPTHLQSPSRTGEPPAAGVQPHASLPRFDNGPIARVRRVLKRHGKKLWWLHSTYALGLGIGVVIFAQKGFDHARWLAISLVVAWLMVLLFFHVYGSGARQSSPDMATTAKAKIRFYAMTYVLKNLYQGMLFFLVPFYWKSTTIDAVDAWFVVVLAACAILSTLDIVFDRFLMRWRALASVFHGVILFGSLNLVIPALFPSTRTLYSLLAAATMAVVSFFTLHVPIRAFARKMNLAILAASTLGVVGVVYLARTAIPPVPMYLSSAGVGPQVLSDGRLAMEVETVHSSVIEQLTAVTDVVVPGGRGDDLRHVWRHDGKDIHPATEVVGTAGVHGTLRLKSQLKGDSLPPQSKLAGHWTVDIETEDGQLVGRTRFDVYD